MAQKKNKPSKDDFKDILKFSEKSLKKVWENKQDDISGEFYIQSKEGYKYLFNKIMTSKKLYNYILNNLQSSLASIGFSNKFIDHFVTDFSKLDFEELHKNFSEELKRVHDLGFFQDIVPDYFNREVIPHIPESNKILDVGCGTGVLIHTLAKNQKFKELIGVDIHRYPEWKKFKDPKILFQILKEKDFKDFLKEKQPDNVVLTWTLHHMSYNQQEEYLRDIYRGIKKGSRVIILEDSYSERIPPKNGKIIYNSFMGFNLSERKQIMSAYDWIANRILARRKNVPIPFDYRTLEEWQNLCEGVGYRVIDKCFIGFPEKRDINTPQSLLIIEK